MTLSDVGCGRAGDGESTAAAAESSERCVFARGKRSAIQCMKTLQR